MKKYISGRDQLGPGLIILALILVVAGYLGGPVLKSADEERRRELANREYRSLGDLHSRQATSLKRQVDLLGPQDLLLGEGNRREFKPLFSPTLTDLMHDAVASTAEEIENQFPDRKYVVRSRLRFYEYSTSRVREIGRPSWHVLSPGLSEGALHDPDAYFYSMEYSDRTITQIDFLITDDIESDERRRARDVLNTLFRETPLRILDVAGNESPVGIPASLRLECNVEQEIIPIGFLGLLAAVFNRLGIIGLLLLFVSPPVWVYLDARKRRLPALLWSMFALLTSALGALIYTLVTREAGPACPECGERVSARFVVCPYCQTELKGTCSTCGQTVGLGWHYCPSCASEV